MTSTLERTTSAAEPALLNDLDVGDRLLNGRLELFSTETAPTNIQLEPPDKKELLSRAAPYLEQVDVDSNTVPLKKQRICRVPSTDNSPECSETEGEDYEDIKSVHDRNELNHTLQQNGRTLSVLSGESADPPSPIRVDVVSIRRRRRRSSSCSSASSFLGTQTAEEAKELLVHLVTTLNACFPHYDFSSVGPDAFIYVEDFVAVYTAINYHLSFLAEAVIPGFLQDLWSVIKDAVDLREASIYSYSNACGQVESDPYLDDEGCLFSFDYFFVDTKHQKILFFSCMTKRKAIESSREWGEGYESAFSVLSTPISEDEDARHSNTRGRRKRSGYESISSSDFGGRDYDDESESIDIKDEEDEVSTPIES